MKLTSFGTNLGVEVVMASDGVSEGSGNDDVILTTLISREPSGTYLSTTTSPLPVDASTTLSSVIRNVIKTTTESVSVTTRGGEVNGDPTEGAPGIVSERLYVFIGVLALLVMVAVGIFLYIKFVHERRQDSFAPTLQRC